MRHLRRWLLIGRALLGVASWTAAAQGVRPIICVSADLSAEGATHARDKLLVEAPGRQPELVVAEAAAHSLRALQVFQFDTACPLAARARLRLVLTSRGRGWPTSELMMTAILSTGEASYQVGLGAVLGAYEWPEPFGDASWVQANLDQHLSRWDGNVRRLFAAIPIDVQAARAGDWVTITGASYVDMRLRPDQAVLSGGSPHGASPKVLFRVCDPLHPSGPIVPPDSLQHCDELTVEPAGTPPTLQLPQVFLWGYWGTM